MSDVESFLLFVMDVLWLFVTFDKEILKKKLLKTSLKLKVMMVAIVMMMVVMTMMMIVIPSVDTVRISSHS